MKPLTILLLVLFAAFLLVKPLIFLAIVIVAGALAYAYLKG